MQLPLRRYRGTFKAPGLPRIDWSNPITQGLVYCGVFSEGGGAPFNLARPGTPTIPNGLSWLRSAEGTTPSFLNTSIQQINCGSTLGLVGAAQLSIVLRPRHANLINTNAESYVSSRVSVNGGFLFNEVGAGGSSPDRTFALVFTLGTVVVFANSAIFGGGDNVPITVGMSFIANNVTGLNYYAKGANVGTVTTATRNMAAGQNIVIGADPIQNTSATSMNGAIEFCYIWNRSLSPQEHATVNVDPYSFVIFPEDDLFAEMVGVVAGGTTVVPWPLFQRIAA